VLIAADTYFGEVYEVAEYKPGGLSLTLLLASSTADPCGYMLCGPMMAVLGRYVLIEYSKRPLVKHVMTGLRKIIHLQKMR
jgi:hypothetical protein